jgi:hypothetical protein
MMMSVRSSSYITNFNRHFLHYRCLFTFKASPMKNVFILLSLFATRSFAATPPIDTLLPVRGFCIGAPSSAVLPDFIKFIKEELVPRQVNTLVLRIDYNYQYKSHPELSDSGALTKQQIKQLVTVCKENHINLIPQVNLLGHQSWAGRLNSFLKVYPQFDETPWVKMPENYVWPNPENLYCKSYCPLHPEVHKIVFELMDEICDVFETKAFHAGMDEVFYLGEAQCPRCGGRDKAELFAGEVTVLRNHLESKGRKLWIWGDRLIDGKTTGLGKWEASFNNTARAIDLIPKDVMICDWHYDHADKTPVIFAMKGLSVITCPWRKPLVAQQQLKDMIQFRESAMPEVKDNYQGMMQTVWSGAEDFMNEFYGRKKTDPAKPPKNPDQTTTNCFKTLFTDIGQLTKK